MIYIYIYIRIIYIYFKFGDKLMASLSLSTWQIHELCVLDWIFAIECIWYFGIYKKNKSFILLANTLILFLISGICIINWHYYNNNYQHYN